jgi:peptidoglycan DL-endopeptidase CwlO
LRETRRLLPAALVAFALVLAIPCASPVRADNTPQLEAERAQLLQQLADLAPARDAASHALATAEAAYSQETAALTQARAQLVAVDSQLSDIAAQINEDRSQEAAAKSELAALTRATYESTTDNTLMTAVLSAKDFTAAMNSLSSASTVTAEIENLETTLTHAESDLRVEEQNLHTDLAHATALENQLSDESNQLMASVYERDQVVDELNGPARQIAERIAEIDDELSGQDVPSSGDCNSGFAYGECTWYVATQRCIPWGGNADAWYYNAAQMGYLEGQTPEVGAVAVWIPGRGGASWVGHVAYVVAVSPTDGIPAGSFEVSEMNWDGWDEVDYRVLQYSSDIFEGFIYGPGPSS